MIILKVLLRQLFGAKYERIIKSLAACFILFLAVHTTEINMEIAASILFLTAAVISAGIMWQALHSSGNAERMVNLFMLPFTNREMTFSYVLVFTGYTLLTKTLPVLALFFAVHEWSVLQIVMALLCASNGCFVVAAWYTMINERKWIPLVVLWCGEMLLAIFFVQEVIVFALIVLASLFLSFLRLLIADAYVLYRPASAKLLIRRTKERGSILLYLLRYLITNKNYLMNTAGLCVAGIILPMILGQFEGLDVMPMGYAILCLNTPICILLSCDPGLEQAVRILPGQAGRFCTCYSLFIFSVNMAVSSVYLVVWQIRHGGVGGMEIMTAVLIALQSAIFSVLLEWFHPIRNWKIESDLWHHPRKYIVPFRMYHGKDGEVDRSTWRQLINVSDDARQKMFDNVKREFIQEKGISNGDTTKRSKIFREYQLSVKKEDRAKGTWTLQQYEGKYRSAMYAAVKAANPKWQPGQPFDSSILDSVTRESVESTLMKSGNAFVRKSSSDSSVDMKI